MKFWELSVPRKNTCTNFEVFYFTWLYHAEDKAKEIKEDPEYDGATPTIRRIDLPKDLTPHEALVAAIRYVHPDCNQAMNAV